MKKDSKVKQPNTAKHYTFNNYCRMPITFIPYWYQCHEVLKNDEITSALVIGQGDNIVPSILRSQGLKVDTFDIIKDMEPTYCGDVRSLGEIVKENYECVLCCEVLEHLPFTDFESMIGQICKIVTKKAIISLPRYGFCGGINIQLPKIHRVFNFHTYCKAELFKCSEHYWEIGRGGLNPSKKEVDEIIGRYFQIQDTYISKECPEHFYWILTK